MVSHVSITLFFVLGCTTGGGQKQHWKINDRMCHWGSVSARRKARFFFFFLEKYVFIFQQTKKRKDCSRVFFSPFLCFIMATWNIGLALSHLRHFTARLMFNRREPKLSSLVLGITHVRSKNIVSPHTYVLEVKLLLVLNLLSSAFMDDYLWECHTDNGSTQGIRHWFYCWQW